MAGVETDPQIAERARGVDPEPAGTPVIARAPAGTPPAGMAAAPGRAAPAPDGGGWDDGAVKWLLAAGLLRKLLAIARSFFANELDLRDWMAPGPAVDFTAGEDVWFDYIA